VNSREVIRLLEEAGFVWRRTKGGHQRWEHPATKKKVTVVHPDKDIRIGTLIAYEKQSGVKLRRR
jgi:predicted RNA binding protein YcfA (HicA-like mRNA interferase family)